MAKTIAEKNAEIKALQEQLASLKADGTTKFNVWTSQKTGKKFLQVKLTHGGRQPLLLSKASFEEISSLADGISQAMEEYAID